MELCVQPARLEPRSPRDSSGAVLSAAARARMEREEVLRTAPSWLGALRLKRIQEQLQHQHPGTASTRASRDSSSRASPRALQQVREWQQHRPEVMAASSNRHCHTCIPQNIKKIGYYGPPSLVCVRNHVWGRGVLYIFEQFYILTRIMGACPTRFCLRVNCILSPLSFGIITVCNIKHITRPLSFYPRHTITAHFFAGLYRPCWV